MVIYGLFSFKIRDVSDRNCRQNQNIFCVECFFFSEDLAVYEIMWKNMVEPVRP
jgi:hypothetical protein